MRANEALVHVPTHIAVALEACRGARAFVRAVGILANCPRIAIVQLACRAFIDVDAVGAVTGNIIVAGRTCAGKGAEGIDAKGCFIAVVCSEGALINIRARIGVCSVAAVAFAAAVVEVRQVCWALRALRCPGTGAFCARGITCVAGVASSGVVPRWTGCAALALVIVWCDRRTASAISGRAAVARAAGRGARLAVEVGVGEHA